MDPRDGTGDGASAPRVAWRARFAPAGRRTDGRRPRPLEAAFRETPTSARQIGGERMRKSQGAERRALVRDQT